MSRTRSTRSRLRVAVASVVTVGATAVPLAPASSADSIPYNPGSVAVVAPEPIPVDGYGHPELAPVVTALRDYMRHRCAGAVTVGVAYQGIPLAEWGLGRTNGRASLPVLDPACGDDTTDPYDPTADDVDHRTPMRVGSVSKTITAATFRWAMKERYEQLTGQPLSDAELEAMSLLGDDFPGGLLPDDLRDLLAGEAPLPAEITECEDLDGAADARWHDVTVGHLLGHRAGLPRSAPDLETKVVPNLPMLRGLETPNDFLVEHSAVRQAADDSSVVDEAANALTGDGGGAVYFLQPPTLVEWLEVVAGRCLEFESEGQTVTVGVEHYSNTSPAFWTVIMEHATGVPFSSAIGDPESHSGTLLQQFFASKVGLNSFAGSGVFRQPATIASEEPGVANPRDWTQSQQTTRPLRADEKRPHCRLVDNVCSFDEWISGERANWAFELDTVPFDRSGVGAGAGTGGLMISPRFMLEFMSRFRVGGYGADPVIGESRTAWSSSASHTGEMNGARAVVSSFSGNYDADFAVPAVDAGGHLTDDFDHLVPGSFDPPAGLDLFVAVNQSSDPKCQASAALNASSGGGGLRSVKAPSSTHYTCKQAYGLLDDFVRYGLSQVDWAEVIEELEAPDAVLGVGVLGPTTLKS